MSAIATILPSCHDWPPILMFFGVGLAAFVIVKWSRAEDVELPKWRWGDAPRRPARDRAGMLAHIVGALLAGLAISYALNTPICG